LIQHHLNTKSELETQKEDAQKLRKCKVCWRYFRRAENNLAGKCGHKGEWHGSFQDCSLLKCAIGLGPSNIGYQHWSCCHDIQVDSPCSKSSFHIEN
jgi:hypothetical protein